MALIFAIFVVAVDQRGKSVGPESDRGRRYTIAWLMLHKIQWAIADRNTRHQLSGLVERDHAYFGGISSGPGKRGHGANQDPVVVEVNVIEQSHPQYTCLELMEALDQEWLLEILKRRMVSSGVGPVMGQRSILSDLALLGRNLMEFSQICCPLRNG